LKWLSSIKNRVPQLSLWRKGDASRPALEPHIIPRDNHPISRKNISDAALKVIARLRSAGFQAYLVGGSVRDLMLGKHPKDFDVATDARPEQVRELFRNSRIIGRRFRIVHVRFGPEIIEVTTFRGSHEPEEAEPPEGRRAPHGVAVRNADGMLLRDNVYGTVEEDAVRRDFTVNALYYTTADFSVRDYTGGVPDLHARLIRMIGDPATRFREDPVRMLRAVRFAAKLNFTIHEQTAEPIYELAPLLSGVAPARLFDETLKLFLAGHAAQTYELLWEYDLFPVLFPATANAIEADESGIYDELVMLALANTDRRVSQQKPVTPAFLYAVLLWPALKREFDSEVAKGVPVPLAVQQAASTVLSDQQRHISIPRRFSLPAREIWELQWRLPNRQPRRVQNLMENPRLRAAYDFLLLREEAGEQLGGLGEWWTRYLEGDENTRAQLLKSIQGRDGGRRRGRGRRSR
jgi:poly(A) polymerase